MSRFQQWAFIVKEALDRSFLVAKFFCAMHVTSTYLCSAASVYGPSMLPTFSLSGEIVLQESISIRYGKVGSGDVVIVRSPENPRKVITKRIIGMEGDSVTYVVDPKNSDRTETLVVPKGHIWVEGDNIYSSNDSRNFGPVPYGLLQGKVFWKIWPAGAFGSIGRRPQTVDPALKVHSAYAILLESYICMICIRMAMIIISYLAKFFLTWQLKCQPSQVDNKPNQTSPIYLIWRWGLGVRCMQHLSSTLKSRVDVSVNTPDLQKVCEKESLLNKYEKREEWKKDKRLKLEAKTKDL